MSNLRGLYTALAAIDITFIKEDTVSETVSAYDLNSIPNTIASANLPIRILTPVNGRCEGIESASSADEASGRIVVWELTDLMLWRPTAHGSGLRDFASDLTRYIDAYELTMRAHRNILTGFDIMSMRFAPDVYGYPAGGKFDYFGVKIILTIREPILNIER